VYKTLSRWGTLATTGHSSNYILTLEVPTRPTRPLGDNGASGGAGGEVDDIVNVAGDADCGRWIKAGVAAFTSLKF
jgi:hypothetical protein